MMIRNVSLEDVRKKIESLRVELDNHNYLYYVKNSPVISDQEFDEMLEELIELENAYPEFIVDDSPSKKVGGTVAEGFDPHEHIVPMMSIDNITNDAEAFDFNGRTQRFLNSTDDIQFIAQPKFDGVSASLVYEEGKLVSAATRGDGKTGEDVTGNIKTIGSVPLRFRNEPDPPRLIEIRGEVIFPIRSFNKLNRRLAQAGEPLFANPRNAASGTLRQLDSSVTAKRPLDFYAWGIGHVDGREFKTETEVMDQIKRWGLKVDSGIKTCKDIKKAISYHHGMEKRRDKLGYEADGVVIKVDEIKLKELLGYTAKYPRWCIAFKFKSRQATTVIEDITVQVGRIGLLTPVAELKPVSIGGITVKRASLHTDNIIRSKDIRIGDTVVIQRAGDVIPDVVKPVLEKRTGDEKPFVMPEKCPVCSTPVEQENAYLYCTNLSCRAQIKGRICHLASKGSFDIEGLGEKIVDQLIEKGLLNDLSDIFYLKTESLDGLEGFAERSSENLINEISKSKKISFERFINALSIKHVGSSSAHLLAQVFNDLDELISAAYEQLTEIHGIGDKMAESIIGFFQNKKNIEVIKKILDSKVEVHNDHKRHENNRFQGITFVVTGTLADYGRNEIKALIKENGGKVVAAVSGKTDYVLYGKDPGSKLDKANDLGIKTINEEDFKNLMK